MVIYTTGRYIASSVGNIRGNITVQYYPSRNSPGQHGVRLC